MARLLALLALLAALGLAACGDDDDDGGGGDGSSPPPAAPAEQTETEPSPAEQRQALEDTSTKPEIPRPTGSPPRRLQTEDIVRGKGPPAEPGDTVVVHYAGVTFSTGEEFDASWNRGQPFPFPLGGGQVIDGWDRGIVGMRVGGRRMLTIPPELAYGAQGFPPAIGPNETLVFVVDLLEIR
ncbi:MAG TPA: FKBP-type peptidyl-prolyl cis-trans isomerase [Thermoleophilaceae bacterium]|nr:FKBP-type peptidyl-prolyl cis-trans isomerase [Thermoleophilaceae bacterium]